MTIELKGAWTEFTDAIKPERIPRVILPEIRRKMEYELQLLRGRVIRYIVGAKHGIPNTALTAALKGSTKPLVDRGDLVNSVTTATDIGPGSVTGYCGVLRTATGKGGGKVLNIADILHEGRVLKKTPAVMRALHAKLRAKLGKDGKFIRSESGSSAFVIRGRPFIRVPFEEAQPRIRAAFGDAVAFAMEKK